MSSDAVPPEEPQSAFRPRDLDGDPVALRALAHPLRLQLLETLTLYGPLTATEASEKVGESPSSCSFHLRTLAKYGFIEEAEGGTGRQRPWRVVAVGNRWTTTSETPAAERAAGEALISVVRARDLKLLDEHLAHADELDDDWRRAAFNSNFGGWLTAQELADVEHKLVALWEPYMGRLEGVADIPDGARLVHMFAYAFPRADHVDDEPPRRTPRSSTDDTDDANDTDDAEKGDR